GLHRARPFLAGPGHRLGPGRSRLGARSDRARIRRCFHPALAEINAAPAAATRRAGPRAASSLTRHRIEERPNLIGRVYPVAMAELDAARAFFSGLSERIEGRLFGVREALRLVLVGILTDSHVLIDDVPGVGKTTLIRMLASLLGLRFSRVQFTPDLMPSDITGTSVLNMKNQEFAFRPGPIFAQILLADEINRATPKTQAALLEAMQERQVTVDGVTYPLPVPFFVLARQNPVELEETFPLPEAQLDRFL